MKRISYILLTVCFAKIAIAQSDATRLAAVVVPSHLPRNFTEGMYVQKIDSFALAKQSFNAIQQQLASNTHFFVKNYGANNLSLLSVRGSNANQIATVWNGLNINMLSQSLLDINLIPSFFTDEVSVVYGGNSALWGSGAVGATIQMQSKLHFNSGTNTLIGMRYGSFGAKNIQAKFSYGAKKIVSSSKIIYNKAKNNFEYYTSGQQMGIKEKIKNNEFEQLGLLQENKFIINNHNQISSAIWLQNTQRQIPPTLTSANTTQSQVDKHLRVITSWHQNYNYYQHCVKAIYSNEFLNYTNKAIGINEDYVTKRFIVEDDYNFQIKKTNFNAGLQYQFGQMESKQYVSNNPTQNKLALSLAVKQNILAEKINILVSARQEYIDSNLIPFVYTLGSTYALNKNLQLNVNFNKVFRLPSFNDLFWIQGGNPNLLAEKGYSAEGGCQYYFSKNQENYFSIELPSKYASYKAYSKLGFNIFSKAINNFINWLPDSNNIWRPKNISTVWSRGIELAAAKRKQFNKVSIEITALYTYLKSTIQKNETSISSINKQLMYVPMHNSNINFNIDYKNWNFLCQNQFIGAVFTTSDNSESLNAYHISNIQVSKMYALNKNSINFTACINNLWNKNYQVVAFNAMPLRNYFISIQVQNKK